MCIQESDYCPEPCRHLYKTTWYTDGCAFKLRDACPNRRDEVEQVGTQCRLMTRSADRQRRIDARIRGEKEEEKK